MPKSTTVLENIETIYIVEGRWDVKFTIMHKDGTEQVFVASADSYFTNNDGIWFGTKNEWHAEVGER